MNMEEVSCLNFNLSNLCGNILIVDQIVRAVTLELIYLCVILAYLPFYENFNEQWIT